MTKKGRGWKIEKKTEKGGREKGERKHPSGGGEIAYRAEGGWTPCPLLSSRARHALP